MKASIAPTPSFSSILFATDFAEEADRALAYAKGIVRANQGTLLLVHVAQPASHISAPEEEWLAAPHRLQGESEEEETERAGIALRAEGLGAEVLCSYGNVSEEISEAARKYRPNLVVVGTHGRHGFRRLLFGSQAERIADGLDVPILIVGPKAPRLSSSQWKPKSILCAPSMNRQGVQLVAFAYFLAKKEGAHLEVRYRSEMHGQLDYPGWNDFEESVKSLLGDGYDGHTRINATALGQREAENLTETASEADVIVLEIPHKLIDWPPQWATGTLSQILAEAPCPVLAVPVRY